MYVLAQKATITVRYFSIVLINIMFDIILCEIFKVE